MKNGHLLILTAVLAGMGTTAAGQVIPNPIPERILGRLPGPEFTVPVSNGSSPNLLEGRELWEPQGVAVDTSLTPPAVYVADTRNHRVLAWRDAEGFWNGSYADAVLGQRDLVSSNPQNPTAAFPGGLNSPVSVAVDIEGRVYVLDAGNNRVVRYRSAFAGENAGQVEMIIGQRARLGRCANQDVTSSNNCVTTSGSASAPDATKLRLSASYLGGALAAAMTLDTEGHLWVTDAGNHRVLRYSRDDLAAPSNITSSGTISPAIEARLVIGQANFVSAVANQGRVTVPSTQIPDRLRRDTLRFPSALAVDEQGRLYVGDDLGRILYYGGDLHDAKQAQRILGIIVLPPGPELPNPVNEFMFGTRTPVNNIFQGGPRGLAIADGRLAVVDTYNSRILFFDRPENWPNEGDQFSPAAVAVWGQENLFSGRPNIHPFREPTAHSLHSPSAATFVNNELWVADSLNHRVLVVPNPLEGGPQTDARGVLGQESYEFRAPNFIQGREFSAGTLRIAVGTQINDLPVAPHMAIDYTSDPPRLYVADPANNRVLGFADARTVRPGDFADVVIGQVDFYRQLANSPYNDPAQPTEFGLLLPGAVAVDTEGHLWVADTGNGRVVRFPRPFDDPENRWQQVDLVIGQPSADTRPGPDPDQGRLLRPISLAFTSQGQLLVADLIHNRVLRYDPPFFTGMDASVVVGQPDFTSGGAGNAPNQLALPYSIAVDSDDRLYVADTGNSRVQIFDRISGQVNNGPTAPINIRLGSGATLMQPVAVAVDKQSGRIWVVDSRNNRIRRFPNFLALFAQPTIAEELSFVATLPVAPYQIALAEGGKILLSGVDHRVTVHAPGIFAEGGTGGQLLFGSTNAASGFLLVTPGAMANLRAPGVRFSEQVMEFSGSRLPLDGNDLEVLVNGRHAPIVRIDNNTIRFIVPWETPIEQVAEFRVRRVSTGETIAYQFQGIERTSPAFFTTANFTLNNNPARQIRARNQNGSENSSSNPASPGSEVTLFLTGYGYIDNPPEDGVAEERVLPIDGDLFVGTPTAGTQVLSSTLDPNEPGVWRIRVRLPNNLFGAPGNQFAIPVVLVHRSRPNSVNPATGAVAFVATIAIRQ